MKEQIQYPKNFEQVVEYVRERWPFLPENYPALAQLDKDKKLVFKFNHVFLHILKHQKGLPCLAKDFKAGVSIVRFNVKSEKTYFKLVIGLVQMVLLLDIPLHEIQEETQADIEKVYSDFVSRVVDTLESADHTGGFQPQHRETLKQSVKDFLAVMIAFEPSEIPWEYFPLHM